MALVKCQLEVRNVTLLFIRLSMVLRRLLYDACNLGNYSSFVNCLSQRIAPSGEITKLLYCMFEYPTKHYFECLIYLLKPLIILIEEIQESSLNFMLIRITYPNP